MVESTTPPSPQTLIHNFNSIADSCPGIPSKILGGFPVYPALSPTGSYTRSELPRRTGRRVVAERTINRLFKIEMMYKDEYIVA
jgi:hypothetical protein